MSAAFGRKLAKRIGYALAGQLMAMKVAEERKSDLGLREVDEPSRADFEIRRALMRSEFTPVERERIRLALDIDPVADLKSNDSRSGADRG